MKERVISHSLNIHVQLSSGSKGLKVDMRLHLNTYFVYASSEGSDETAHTHMRSLV